MTAATAATVAATLGTSFLGVAGTLTGVVAASLITGGGAWWFERWLRRWTAKTRALAEARRRKGRPLRPEETHFIAAVSNEQQDQTNRVRGIPWRLAGASAGVVLLAAVAVILFIELGTGKPVSAVVQGKPASGLLAPVSTPEPSQTFTPAPKSTPAAKSPSATPSPSVSPSASPSVSPGTPSATPSPAVTTAPPSVIPATTPAVTPSLTPSPGNPARGGNAGSAPIQAPSA
jgi:hypothetical protein